MFLKQLVAFATHMPFFENIYGAKERGGSSYLVND